MQLKSCVVDGQRTRKTVIFSGTCKYIYFLIVLLFSRFFLYFCNFMFHMVFYRSGRVDVFILYVVAVSDVMSSDWSYWIVRLFFCGQKKMCMSYGLEVQHQCLDWQNVLDIVIKDGTLIILFLNFGANGNMALACTWTSTCRVLNFDSWPHAFGTGFMMVFYGDWWCLYKYI